MVEAPVEDAGIALLQEVEHGVTPFFYVVLEQQSAENGRNEKSEQQGTQKGERDRPSHRPEQAAFHAFQSENGKIGHDDDDSREEDRLLHFVRGRSDHFNERL